MIRTQIQREKKKPQNQYPTFTTSNFPEQDWSTVPQTKTQSVDLQAQLDKVKKARNGWDFGQISISDRSRNRVQTKPDDIHQNYLQPKLFTRDEAKEKVKVFWRNKRSQEYHDILEILTVWHEKAHGLAKESPLVKLAYLEIVRDKINTYLNKKREHKKNSWKNFFNGKMLKNINRGKEIKNMEKVKQNVQSEYNKVKKEYQESGGGSSLPKLKSPFVPEIKQLPGAKTDKGLSNEVTEVKSIVIKVIS